MRLKRRYITRHDRNGTPGRRRAWVRRLPNSVTQPQRGDIARHDYHGTPNLGGARVAGLACAKSQKEGRQQQAHQLGSPAASRSTARPATDLTSKECRGRRGAGEPPTGPESIPVRRMHPTVTGLTVGFPGELGRSSWDRQIATAQSCRDDPSRGRGPPRAGRKARVGGKPSGIPTGSGSRRCPRAFRK